MLRNVASDPVKGKGSDLALLLTRDAVREAMAGSTCVGCAGRVVCAHLTNHNRSEITTSHVMMCGCA